MAKILIAISSDIYVRNYLRTDAIQDILKEHDCDLIADASLALATEVGNHPNFQSFYDADERVDRRHQLLFNLMMWRYRRRSPTFLYRWLRNSQWHLVQRNRGWFQFLLSATRWIGSAIANPVGLRIPILGNSALFPLSSRLLKSQLPINSSLQKIVETGKYEVVIFPSAAFDSVSVDLIRLGKKYSIVTLCLIDNWDNLTSKTVFWRRPDHLGVWGQQAKNQALSIHGFEDHQVHLIGTPRFDSYFHSRTTRPAPSPYLFPYILFAGSAMPFDELEALHNIETIIGNSPAFPSDLRIIYRPHPWQQKRSTKANFLEKDYVGTLLDSQIAEGYSSGVRPETTVPGFQPDLDYYPILLRNASLVIGPLTTMLFEASLCLRPVVALSYFDGHHINTTKRYFSHFQGMENVPGFSFCEEREALASQLELAIRKPDIGAADSDDKTKFFLFQSDDSYPSRLASLVDKLLG